MFSAAQNQTTMPGFNVKEIIFAAVCIIIGLIMLHRPQPQKSDLETTQFVDKWGQFYTLQRCDCADGIPPADAGFLMPMTAQDAPRPFDKVYTRVADGQPIWLEKAGISDADYCGENRFWRIVKSE
jgi:hypothetical protein